MGQQALARAEAGAGRFAEDLPGGMGPYAAHKRGVCSDQLPPGNPL